MSMSISRAARESGLSPKMIRHYEEIGLISPPRRAANGYRYFSRSDVENLGFIRRARALGFSMDETRELVSLWQRRAPSAQVKAIAQRHVEHLEARIREMLEMAATLQKLADHCQGNERPDCPIIDELAGRVSAGDSVSTTAKGGEAQ